MAIGNPLGLAQTLTRGVGSALNRILPETPFALQEPLIQTDTPINPGNSGGPLLNRCGHVIGITTAVIPDAQNIGFAIPMNLVRAMLPTLASEGRIIRPWVGFHGTLVDGNLREWVRIPIADGLLVEVVEPGSPAERVGLRGGRLELAIGGRSILLGGDVVTQANGVALAQPDATVRCTMSSTFSRSGPCFPVTCPRRGQRADTGHSPSGGADGIAERTMMTD